MANSIPKQCLGCLHFNSQEQLCKIYEQLPGEYGREMVHDCPSFVDEQGGSGELKALIEYIDGEDTGVLEEGVLKIVDKVLSNYPEKFKIIVVGMARRKIKSMIQMVDITDKLINKLSESIDMDNITSGQAIRLLSELNNAVNNDLGFIMKLVNPDTRLQDFQTYIDARSITVSGSSPKTEQLADNILELSSTSRDKIRDAFGSLINHIKREEDYQDVELMDDFIDGE